MHERTSISSRKFLELAIPRTAKYDHIGPATDSGCTVANYQRKLSEQGTDALHPGNRPFGRVGPVTLGRLIYEAHLEHDLVHMEKAIADALATTVVPRPATPLGSDFRRKKSDLNASNGSPSAMDQPRRDRMRDSVHYLMVDPNTSAAPAAPELFIGPRRGLRFNGSAISGYDLTLPYLLLDVRESMEWEKAHIIGALPYPAPIIKRDQMSRELMMYKNNVEKIIILYDMDETIASNAAQVLGERGFENVYIVAGESRQETGSRPSTRMSMASRTSVETARRK